MMLAATRCLILFLEPLMLNLARALCVLAVAPTVLLAQDTPTERAAAGGVLQKMSALEQSLDIPKLVARAAAPNPVRDAVAARAKELMDKELLALADDITKHPEVGFK